MMEGMLMKQFTACVLGASLLAATGAFAQSSAPDSRYYFTGYAELGYYDRGSSDSPQYRGDVDMGFTLGDSANGLGFGVSLGIDAVGNDAANETAFYPALEFGTGIGKFSIGVPRSVLDRGYFPEPKFGNNSFLDIEFRGVQASALGYFHLFGDKTPLGIRYDGVFGNTKVGASYHNLERSGNDLDAFAVAVSHTFSGPSSMIDYMIYGGFEHQSVGTVDETSYRIGFEGYSDKITAGLSYTDNGFPFGVKLASLYIDYTIRDALTVTGSLGHADVGGGRNFYGLGVQYDFLKNAYLKASAVDYDTSPSPVVEVMLGWTF